jgi:hypothetical protein
MSQSTLTLAAVAAIAFYGHPASAVESNILPLLQAQTYIERFNADDREVFSEAIPNAKAWEFLSANIPIFECPDEELERTYYFRWWSFRKHLKQTPAGWIITEFLPKVSWSNEYNAINCCLLYTSPSPRHV